MNDLAGRLRAQFEEQYEVQPDGCWLWTGPMNGEPGYGTMKVFGGYALAHRLSYELFVGPIPDGLVIDHLCNNRPCVNYEHLEPVTYRENILRGNGLAAHNARKTHCPKDHPLSGDNLRIYGKRRFCHACSIESQRLARRRRGILAHADPPSADALRKRQYRERQKQLVAARS